MRRRGGWHAGTASRWYGSRGATPWAGGDGCSRRAPAMPSGWRRCTGRGASAGRSLPAKSGGRRRSVCRPGRRRPLRPSPSWRPTRGRWRPGTGARSGCAWCGGGEARGRAPRGARSTLARRRPMCAASAGRKGSRSLDGTRIRPPWWRCPPARGHARARRWSRPRMRAGSGGSRSVIGAERPAATRGGRLRAGARNPRTRTSPEHAHAHTRTYARTPPPTLGGEGLRDRSPWALNLRPPNEKYARLRTGAGRRPLWACESADGAMKAEVGGSVRPVTARSGARGGIEAGGTGHARNPPGGC